MTRYANVKRNTVIRFLNWLATKEDVFIRKGGKHTYNIKYVLWDRPFPVPFKHNEVDRFIIEALMKKLVKSNICTEDEFDEKIK